MTRTSAVVAANDLPSTGTLLQRTPCGCDESGEGECDTCRDGRIQGLQRKLLVSGRRDPSESEADRVADRIIGGGSARPSPVPTHVQRAAVDAGAPAPSSVGSALRRAGRPLPPSVQADMEQRLGHAFSNVWIFTEARRRAETERRRVMLSLSAPRQPGVLGMTDAELDAAANSKALATRVVAGRPLRDGRTQAAVLRFRVKPRTDDWWPVEIRATRWYDANGQFVRRRGPMSDTIVPHGGPGQ